MTYPNIDFDRLEYAEALEYELKKCLPQPWEYFAGYRVFYEPDGFLVINRFGYNGATYPYFPMGHVSKVGAVHFLRLVKMKLDYENLKEDLRILIQSGMCDSAEWEIRKEYHDLGSDWSLATV